MSTSVKEGISPDETISAVTPVSLEKGGLAKMLPTKHMYIQAAAPSPGSQAPQSLDTAESRGAVETGTAQTSCASL